MPGWFAGQETAGLFLGVSEAELRAEAAYLPAGRRREGLAAAIDAMIAEDFAGRVLSFDSAAARSFAVIAAARRAADQPIAEADCQMAATALAHGAAVATRNVADFLAAASR